MGYNKDLMTPLLLYSTNYTTCHTLTHCTNTSLPHKSLQKLCNISESSNDEQMITGQSRWNPTREQMMELEEVYRSGTRTPTTQQIQEIASKLQKYGRCEGKNVFYWFQNHKSRERLKRRRPDQQEGPASSNVPEEEPLRKDNLVGSENQDSSVLRRRGSLLSSSPTHPQNNNNDYGKMERGLVEEKEATWQNKLNPINTSDNCDYQMVITSKRSQEAEHYSMNEEEEARKSRTLDLFPVIESQEKTDATGFEEKNTKPNQFCTNYFYYYEFMPLMN